jgi:hypothetical protein
MREENKSEKRKKKTSTRTRSEGDALLVDSALPGIQHTPISLIALCSNIASLAMPSSTRELYGGAILSSLPQTYVDARFVPSCSS